MRYGWLDGPRLPGAASETNYPSNPLHPLAPHLPFCYRTGEVQALKNLIRSLPGFATCQPLVTILMLAVNLCAVPCCFPTRIVKDCKEDESESSSGDNDEVGNSINISVRLPTNLRSLSNDPVCRRACRWDFTVLLRRRPPSTVRVQRS